MGGEGGGCWVWWRTLRTAWAEGEEGSVVCVDVDERQDGEEQRQSHGEEVECWCFEGRVREHERGYLLSFHGG